MTEYEVHEPTFRDTSTERWEAPDRSEFDGDDLESVAEHFLASESGFPPESFDDLAFPVVDADGTLNLHGLQNAHTGPASVETAGVDEETRRAIKDAIEGLIHTNFDPDETDLDEQLDDVRFEAYEEYREHVAEHQSKHEDVERSADAEEIANPNLRRSEGPNGPTN